MVKAPAADFPEFNLSSALSGGKTWTTFAVSQAKADQSALVLLRAEEYKEEELAQIILKDDFGTAVSYATVEIEFVSAKTKKSTLTGRLATPERKEAGENTVFRCTADAKGRVTFPSNGGEYKVRYSG